MRCSGSCVRVLRRRFDLRSYAQGTSAGRILVKVAFRDARIRPMLVLQPDHLQEPAEAWERSPPPAARPAPRRAASATLPRAALPPLGCARAACAALSASPTRSFGDGEAAVRVRAAALEVHDRLVHRVAPPLARPADRPRRPQRQARCLTVRCGVVLCGNVRYSRTGWCLRRAGGLRMCESPGSVPHTGTRWALSGCERPFRAGFSDGPAELVGGHKVRPAATEPKPPLAGGRNFSAQCGG